ncbi:MarR family winged helix-turn-helix transcriptional regulator [Aurantimonas sp. VKM B-3413]|uniref:MarR family winged helix-turn-helix transcriptional regulator n=1 Tax=Aurantimonas sp. VKM B-3413 TaxID=2779401 RepID=UPI001E35923A|nr:MarR family transcriptional regulator [Aurantimonas sp. VKM B-3413]MCB8840535.1 MarR family transcriptional regulator [Aurantimonas sp. VKM B-3413]
MSSEINEINVAEKLGAGASRSRSEDVDLGQLDDFVGFYLRLAYEACFSDFTQRLGPDSLKPGNFALLSLISANPGITQVELGRSSGRDKSSVTIGLRQMEDEGLIDRIRLEEDRRVYASYITPAGAELFERISATAAEHMAVLDAIVGPERKGPFLGVLKDIVGGLERARKG